jgi:hypothetical protein
MFFVNSLIKLQIINNIIYTTKSRPIQSRPIQSRPIQSRP